MFKLLKKLVKIIILALIIIIAIFVFQGYSLYKKSLEEISIEDKITEIKSSIENYTDYNKLPKNYVNAVIAAEDRSFFKHNGINLASIGRAFVTDIKEKRFAEGGSTITQQLAKNIYFTQKKEITRKVAEVFMAFEIERQCTKEEIFELYVNTIYFGNGYYCVYDAAQGYFNKDVQALDLYECSLLAGIPNAPSVYAPTANPELSKQRQAQVLYKMVKYKYLTQEEADVIHEGK